MNRRQFLRSFAFGGLVLAGCEEGRDPYDGAHQKPLVPGAKAWTPGQEKEVATACDQCPAGCGIRVRVVEGRAVKIEGLPGNPVNRGGIGPRGLAGVQALYDPDRITGPLVRRGPRGSGRLEPIGWDEALELLAGRLAGLRKAGESHRLAIASGKERGLTFDLLSRLAKAYGTPNLFDPVSTRSGPMVAAMGLTQGVFDLPAYDWSTTRYVLSFGSGVFEASCQQVYFTRAAGQLRRGRPGGRAKIVQVAAAGTRTAVLADEWIRILPGTAGAFALGIGHVLARDGTFDQAFVAERCAGFERFRDVLAAYPPGRVAEICGTPAEVVERIAAEVAASRPATAFADCQELLAANGVAAATAIHSLNALLGAIDRPGGVLVQRPAPLAAWPEPELDDAARAGAAQPRLDGAGSRFPLAGSVVDAFPEAIEAGDPCPVDTLLLHYRNPVYARAEPERWRRALRRIPFVVTFTPFLDETAAGFADLVLPDSTGLERWDDAGIAPSTGFPVYGIRQPVVAPLHDTRSTADVVLDLARRLGGPVEAAFPWSDAKTAIAARVAGLPAGKKAMKALETAGFWADETYAFEDWAGSLRTASGRFEFHAPEHVELAWKGDADRYPLLLLPYTPGTYAEGSGANLPWLQELAADLDRPMRTSEAEIHPDTARAAGIEDGDAVVVESPVGRIEARARVDRQAHPGAVRIARGGGHTAFGRWASGWGANVMELVSAADLDPLAGTTPILGTRVSIRRAIS